MEDIPGSELTTQDLDDIDMLEDRILDGKQLVVDLIKFYDTYDEMMEYRVTIPKSQGVLWCENPTFRGKDYKWILVLWHT
jgi:hypothetical protein